MEYQNPYNSYNQQAQNDGSFGWDDVIKEESSFTLLPEGNYRFTIKSFSKARYNGGDKIPACNKAIVTFDVFTPDGKSTELSENFLLHQKMEWKLSEFFASVGLKNKNEPVRMLWTPELIGKSGICKIIVHNYKKDGEDRQINRIEKLYPSYDQPQISSQPVRPNPAYAQQPAPQYQQPAPSQCGWTQGKF